MNPSNSFWAIYFFMIGAFGIALAFYVLFKHGVWGFLGVLSVAIASMVWGVAIRRERI